MTMARYFPELNRRLNDMNKYDARSQEYYVVIDGCVQRKQEEENGGSI